MSLYTTTTTNKPTAIGTSSGENRNAIPATKAKHKAFNLIIIKLRQTDRLIPLKLEYPDLLKEVQ